MWSINWNQSLITLQIRVITKLPNSEQSYKGKVKTHNYINRQNQSTTGKLWNMAECSQSNTLYWPIKNTKFTGLNTLLYG
jgi:hypothetical protein